MEEILTASQVAHLLQVHPRTVYKLVKQGFIPGRKFGGGWRFSKGEIMQMISLQGPDRSTQPRSASERVASASVSHRS
jgi:excisionase family DNA binding protein